MSSNKKSHTIFHYIRQQFFNCHKRIKIYVYKHKKTASHYGGDLNERITKLIVWLKRDVHEINQCHTYKLTLVTKILNKFSKLGKNIYF